MNSKKTDECNENMEPSSNPEQPVFRIPKCWEEHQPPPGYFDPVDPCSDPPSLVLDHRGLWDYAKSIHSMKKAHWILRRFRTRTDIAITWAVVSRSFAMTSPMPHLRFARLNLRSTSTRSHSSR